MSQIPENKGHRLLIREIFGKLTFMAILVGFPILMSAYPEATILPPAFIIGLVAAGLLSISRG